MRVKDMATRILGHASDEAHHLLLFPRAGESSTLPVGVP